MAKFLFFKVKKRLRKEKPGAKKCKYPNLQRLKCVASPLLFVLIMQDLYNM